MQMKECNQRLEQILVPHDFSRASRSLEPVKHWKGKQYMMIMH